MDFIQQSEHSPSDLNNLENNGGRRGERSTLVYERYDEIYTDGEN